MAKISYRDLGQSAHLFFCGSGFKGAGLFAVTNDKNGANLPRPDCPAGWGFDRTTEITDGQVGGIAIDEKAAKTGLEKEGFFVFHVKGKTDSEVENT